MKVSVVTISYNQADFLEMAIRSVIEQDYPLVEYIVVDPGSTDGSRGLIEKYRDHIDHIILQPDNGPADGLNRGLHYANGDIYACLNADDILNPGAISRMVKAFKNSDVDVISGHGYKIDAEGRVLGKIYSHRFDPVSYIHGACILVQQSTFFRADAFWRVGGFNVENRVSWDGELWFDMAMSGAQFARIGGYWSGFRMHPNSITASERTRHMEEKVKARLAERLGFSTREINNLVRQKSYWFKNRICDPAVSLMRFWDAL